MKKFIYLLSAITFFTFFYSCNSDDDQIISPDNKKLELKSNETFFEGQIENIDEFEKSSRFLDLRCGVSGVICGSPNQSLTYTYSTSVSNPYTSWSVDSGDITIQNGQGTNIITLHLGNNFNGGFVRAQSSTSPSCVVIFEILLCGSPGPISNSCDFSLGMANCRNNMGLVARYWNDSYNASMCESSIVKEEWWVFGGSLNINSGTYYTYNGSVGDLWVTGNVNSQTTVMVKLTYSDGSTNTFQDTFDVYNGNPCNTTGL